ncbi:MAG: AAA family ATPase [Methanobacteriota archaeon]|nr:MAG: AAA family ATPase [Euryarchaeota archaeon]
MKKKVKLRVEEASRGDIGRQIARIPADIAELMGIKTGDVLKIRGTRDTFAQAWRSNQDTGREIIKIESSIRRNAGVALNDMVEVMKVTKVNTANTVLMGFSEHVPPEFVGQVSRALGGRIIGIGDIFPISIGFGKYVSVKILDVKPEPPAIISPSTKLTSTNLENEVEEGELHQDRVSYEDIGGLEEPIRKIREMVELPLKYPEIFEHLGVTAPKGVLMYGPPGTGKTLLAKAVASETNSHFILINGPEIMSKYYGESEEKLRNIFSEAKKKSPTIIFIDEIDAIAPKRNEAGGETERRIVAQLLTLMDGLDERGQIVVIGATNRPNSIDEALRRGGRFDRELEIGVPDRSGREEILEILTRGMPLSKNVKLREIAENLHGYVGADIAILVKEAALISLRRFIPRLEMKETKRIDPSFLNQIEVTMEDFQKAMDEIRPSAMREVFIEKPDINWNDIGGLKHVKKELIRAIEWPIKFPNIYRDLRIKTSRGILLYGPPGSGKTLLAKAVAGQIQANFISIRGPELLSKYVGETERAIREVFEKARRAAPAVIFFDEIDAIAPSRKVKGDQDITQRIVSQLLTEMDGIKELQGVFVLAATNRLDIIDPALRRPGRFTKVIEIPLPNQEEREEIFKVHLDGVAIGKDIDFQMLGSMTKGFTGAEIAEVVTIAKEELIKELIEERDPHTAKAHISRPIQLKHLKVGLANVKPSEIRYTLKPPKTGEMDYA